MTLEEFETLVSGDAGLVQKATCPLEQYPGNKPADVRERFVVYRLVEKNISKADIQRVLESFAAGEPYQQSEDKTTHLDAIFTKAKEKQVTEPQIRSAIPLATGKMVKRPKIDLFFG